MLIRYSKRLTNVTTLDNEHKPKNQHIEKDKSVNYHIFIISGPYIRTAKPKYTSGSYGTRRQI